MRKLEPPTVRIEFNYRCDECKGTGQVRMLDDGKDILCECSDCNGHGDYFEEKFVTIIKLKKMLEGL